MAEWISLIGSVMGKSYKIHIHLSQHFQASLSPWVTSFFPQPSLSSAWTCQLLSPPWGRVFVHLSARGRGYKKDMAACSGHPQNPETSRQEHDRDRLGMVEQPARRAWPCHLLSQPKWGAWHGLILCHSPVPLPSAELGAALRPIISVMGER